MVAQARPEPEFDIAAFFRALIWLVLRVSVYVLLEVLLLGKSSHAVLALELFDAHMDGEEMPFQSVLV